MKFHTIYYQKHNTIIIINEVGGPGQRSPQILALLDYRGMHAGSQLGYSYAQKQSYMNHVNLKIGLWYTDLALMFAG